MAGATLATADSALQEFYIPGAREQLNNDIPFLSQIEKNTKDIEGRRAVLAPHISRNSGVGARASGGTLPTAGAQGYAEERIPLFRNYGRIQLDGQLIKAMKSDRASFVRATTSEMDGVTRDLKREVSRQIWGNADGKIATCGTTSGSATVQLDAATTVVQMRFFQVGDRLDIGTAANPTLRVAGATVVSVNAAALTVTIDSSITTAATDFVFRSGNVGASTVNEVTGMQKIVAASGTLHNINNAVWASRVDTAVGALSENKMAQHVQGVQILSGNYPKMFIADDGSFRAFGALLTGQKRSTNTQALKGGYSALAFNAAGPEQSVVWDRDCPFGCMFSIDPERLFEFRMADWEWMSEDGAVLSRVSGVDAYEAVLFMYHELATDERNAAGLMSGITTA